LKSNTPTPLPYSCPHVLLLLLLLRLLLLQYGLPDAC
jgi:hypothetical protein